MKSIWVDICAAGNQDNNNKANTFNEIEEDLAYFGY